MNQIEPASRTPFRGPVAGAGDFYYYLDDQDRIRRQLSSGFLKGDGSGEFVPKKDAPPAILEALGIV